MKRKPKPSREAKRREATRIKIIAKRIARQINARRKAARYANIKEYEKARLLNLRNHSDVVVIRSALMNPSASK